MPLLSLSRGARRGVLAAAVLGAASSPRRRPRRSPALEVVTGGLANPRGLTVGPGGQIYVAEAGSAGRPRASPARRVPRGPICSGATGAITKVAPARATSQRWCPTCRRSPRPSAPTHRPAGHLVRQARRLPHRRSRRRPGRARSSATRAPASPRSSASATASCRRSPTSATTRPRTIPTATPSRSAWTRTHSPSTHGRSPDLGPDAPPEPAPGTPVPYQAVPTGVIRGPDGAAYVGQLTDFPSRTARPPSTASPAKAGRRPSSAASRRSSTAPTTTAPFTSCRSRATGCSSRRARRSAGSSSGSPRTERRPSWCPASSSSRRAWRSPPTATSRLRQRRLGHRRPGRAHPRRERRPRREGPRRQEAPQAPPLSGRPVAGRHWRPPPRPA